MQALTGEQSWCEWKRDLCAILTGASLVWPAANMVDHIYTAVSEASAATKTLIRLQHPVPLCEAEGRWFDLIHVWIPQFFKAGLKFIWSRRHGSKRTRLNLQAYLQLACFKVNTTACKLTSERDSKLISTWMVKLINSGKIIQVT